MKTLTCITMTIVLLSVSSGMAAGRWSARLRVVPVGLGLKVNMVFRAHGGPTGEMMDLQFEFQNLTDAPVTIDWSRSSLKLPSLGRETVRPADSSGTDTPTTTVPARSRITVRVCPIQSPPGPCSPAWLRRAMLVEDFSLKLSLAIETSQGVRTEEWRWDFDYHADVATEQPASPNRTLLSIGLAAAAFVVILLLLFL